MNSDEKFEEIYSKILSEYTEKLETMREEAKIEVEKNRKAMNSLIPIFFAFIFFASFVVNSALIIVKVICFFVAIKIFINGIEKIKSIKKSKLTEYTDEFKTKVIKFFLDSFNENLAYYPNSGISFNNYVEAEFETYDRYKQEDLINLKLENTYNFQTAKKLIEYLKEDENLPIYKSEDLMEGKLKNNCNFQMAEVITQGLKRGYKTNYYDTMFCGIFTKIETPKPFNAKVYLRKDFNDKNIVDRLIKDPLPFENLRVNLDSQEFEKYFDVYCTDKIIAMQLLTPDIMEMLVSFQQEMNMDYELTIKNNSIYIRFFSEEMFDVTTEKFSLDKNMIYRYYKMIEFSILLSNKLIKLIDETEYDL